MKIIILFILLSFASAQDSSYPYKHRPTFLDALVNKNITYIVKLDIDASGKPYNVKVDDRIYEFPTINIIDTNYLDSLAYKYFSEVRFTKSARGIAFHLKLPDLRTSKLGSLTALSQVFSYAREISSCIVYDYRPTLLDDLKEKDIIYYVRFDLDKHGRTKNPRIKFRFNDRTNQLIDSNKELDELAFEYLKLAKFKINDNCSKKKIDWLIIF